MEHRLCHKIMVFYTIEIFIPSAIYSKYRFYITRCDVPRRNEVAEGEYGITLHLSVSPSVHLE